MRVSPADLLIRKDRRSDDDREDRDDDRRSDDSLEDRPELRDSLLETFEWRLDATLDPKLFSELLNFRNVDFRLVSLTRLLGCDTKHIQFYRNPEKRCFYPSLVGKACRL